MIHNKTFIRCVIATLWV